MSRSYRKHPYLKDGNGGRHRVFAKKQANRVVRRASIVQNGMYYKKLFCSWNINDYISNETLNDFIRREWNYYYNGYFRTEIPDEEKVRIEWFKTYKRK